MTQIGAAPRPPLDRCVEPEQEYVVGYTSKECFCCRKAMQFSNAEEYPVCTICTQHVIKCSLNTIRKSLDLEQRCKILEDESKNKEGELRCFKVRFQTLESEHKELKCNFYDLYGRNQAADEALKTSQKENVALKIKMEEICKFYSQLETTLQAQVAKTTELEKQLAMSTTTTHRECELRNRQLTEQLEQLQQQYFQLQQLQRNFKGQQVPYLM